MQEFNDSFFFFFAEDFIDQVLISRLKAELVVVGRGFHFGYKAKGNPDLLRSSGAFSVLECKDERIQIDQKEISVSSSLIREFVSQGQLQNANACLDYDYFLTGRVLAGDSRGHQIGYPTANIEGERECLPPPGVYVTMLEDVATGHYFASVSNLGFAPTFARDRFLIEAHLLGFDGNLYNREVRLFFLDRIRDEKKFSNVSELKGQIERDIERSMQLFAERKFLHTRPSKNSLSLDDPSAESQSYSGLDFIQKVL